MANAVATPTGKKWNSLREYDEDMKAERDGLTSLNPEPLDLLQTTDAREWAREFVRMNTVNPEIATDEATMTTWFANAIMVGYDRRGVA